MTEDSFGVRWIALEYVGIRWIDLEYVDIRGITLYDMK